MLTSFSAYLGSLKLQNRGLLHLIVWLVLVHPPPPPFSQPQILGIHLQMSLHNRCLAQIQSALFFLATIFILLTLSAPLGCQPKRCWEVSFQNLMMRMLFNAFTVLHNKQSVANFWHLLLQMMWRQNEYIPFKFAHTPYYLLLFLAF